MAWRVLPILAVSIELELGIVNDKFVAPHVVD
jgi:hypothetical protein